MFGQLLFDFQKTATDAITTEDIIALIQKSFGLVGNTNTEWKIVLRRILKKANNNYRISVKFADMESLLNFIRKPENDIKVSINKWDTGNKSVYIMLLITYK